MQSNNTDIQAQHNWDDWHWQMQHLITTEAEADKVFHLTDKEKEAFAQLDKLRMPFAITPYYAEVIKDSPMRAAHLPSLLELISRPLETDDPLGEEICHPAPTIIHKYHNRALLLTDNFCPAYCRYCTRGRITSKLNFVADWEQDFKYLEQHEEIIDVLISGGEPLLLSDEKLEYLLSRLKSIKHIKLIKIGTKAPISLPQRVTPRLVSILKAHNPLFLSLHINHASEITPEVKGKLNLLADSGIILGSQSVLLKGINDSAATLYDLFYKLLENRVRPYYLFQCDPIAGSGHFRVPLKRGLEIMDELRKTASGYAIPTYAVDIPNRFGKIAVLPNHIKEGADGKVFVENFDGELYPYPE